MNNNVDTATLEAVKHEIVQISDEVTSRIDAKVNPMSAAMDDLSAKMLQLQKDIRDTRKANILKSIGGLIPRVQEGKYAGLDRLQLAMIEGLRSKQPLDTPAQRAMVEQWRLNLAAAMDSTTTGAGDELVPTEHDNQLWMDVNLEAMVLGLFQHIQMPTNPFENPLQLGDMNFYPGVENIAAKSTALSTAKKTMTAYELVGEVPWSYDIDEDAVIAMMSEVTEGITRNAAEVIDDVLVNADTTVTNNINADGATIAATDAGKGQWLLGFNGLRHLPLVDATGQGNNHNAAISLDAFNENRRNMGKYGVRPSQCAHLMDISTYLIAQTLTGFQTLDKFGPQATLLTGQLGAVEGVPVIVPEKMLKTAADGKVTDGAAGTVGGILTVNRTQWRVGFRRQITFEAERSASKRQNLLIVSFRIAFEQRESTIANATHTALNYNITGL